MMASTIAITVCFAAPSNLRMNSKTNFSRHSGVMALHMAKPAFADFLRSMFGTLLNLDLKTVSISGHKDFQAWEWEMSFVKKEGGSDWDDLDKGVSGEDGTMKMKGVSLSWWDEKGEQIVRECDYARFV